MANLTAAREYEVVGRTEILRVKGMPNTQFYKGGMVQFESNLTNQGLAKKAAAVSLNEYAVGVLVRDYGPSVNAIDMEVEVGKVWIPSTTANTQMLVGQYAWATDDATIGAGYGQTIPAATGVCGLIVDAKPGFVLVDFRRAGPRGSAV